MNDQKPHKEYIHITNVPIGMRIENKIDEKDICVWHACGECQTSGLRDYLGKRNYDGMACKCFAYSRTTEKK